MNNVLFWFGIYLLIGLSFIASVHIKGWLSKSIDQADNSMDWKEQTAAELMVILFWPPVVGMLVYEGFFNRPQPAPVYRSWIATPGSLIEHLSIEAIEQIEIYSDPLNAVPTIPFGHLHQAWLRFRHTLQSTDQIWFFRADTRDDEGLDWCQRHGVVEGYAALRDGEIIGEFFARMG